MEVDLHRVDEYRDIDHRDHDRRADHEVGEQREPQVSATEQSRVDQRVARSPLMPGERNRSHDGNRIQPSKIGTPAASQLIKARDALDLGVAEQRQVQRDQEDRDQQPADPVNA